MQKMSRTDQDIQGRHLSHSQLSMWLRCPKQYEFRYIHNMRMPPAGALIQGSCYHKALEVNFSYKIDHAEDRPLDEVLDAYADEWEHLTEDGDNDAGIDWEDKEPGVLKDEGIGLVKVYHALIAPDVQPLKVETFYQKMLDGVNFVGYIDLETELVDVIDHKTAGRSYNQDDVDRDIQISAYAWLLGREIKAANHVAVKTKQPKIQIVETVRTKTDIRWWRDMALEVKRAIDKGVFPPSPTGWHCGPKWCGYWNLCRGE